MDLHFDFDAISRSAFSTGYSSRSASCKPLESAPASQLASSLPDLISCETSNIHAHFGDSSHTMLSQQPTPMFQDMLLTQGGPRSFGSSPLNAPASVDLSAVASPAYSMMSFNSTTAQYLTYGLNPPAAAAATAAAPITAHCNRSGSAPPGPYPTQSSLQCQPRSGHYHHQQLQLQHQQYQYLHHVSSMHATPLSTVISPTIFTGSPAHSDAAVPHGIPDAMMPSSSNNHTSGNDMFGFRQAHYETVRLYSQLEALGTVAGAVTPVRTPGGGSTYFPLLEPMNNYMSHAHPPPGLSMPSAVPLALHQPGTSLLFGCPISTAQPLPPPPAPQTISHCDSLMMAPMPMGPLATAESILLHEMSRAKIQGHAKSASRHDMSSDVDSLMTLAATGTHLSSSNFLGDVPLPVAEQLQYQANVPEQVMRQLPEPMTAAPAVSKAKTSRARGGGRGSGAAKKRALVQLAMDDTTTDAAADDDDGLDQDNKSKSASRGSSTSGSSSAPKRRKKAPPVFISGTIDPIALPPELHGESSPPPPPKRRRTTAATASGPKKTSQRPQKRQQRSATEPVVMATEEQTPPPAPLASPAPPLVLTISAPPPSPSRGGGLWLRSGSITGSAPATATGRPRRRTRALVHDSATQSPFSSPLSGPVLQVDQHSPLLDDNVPDQLAEAVGADGDADSNLALADVTQVAVSPAGTKDGEQQPVQQESTTPVSEAVMQVMQALPADEPLQHALDSAVAEADAAAADMQDVGDTTSSYYMETNDDCDDSDLMSVSSEYLATLPQKEKRMLRNKISARNFRLRRKEHIEQLECQVFSLKEELAAEKRWRKASMILLHSIQVRNAELEAKIAGMRVDGTLEPEQLPPLSPLSASDLSATSASTLPPLPPLSLSAPPKPTLRVASSETIRSGSPSSQKAADDTHPKPPAARPISAPQQRAPPPAMMLRCYPPSVARYFASSIEPRPLP
ncbi:hypothetical protein BC828DRAFT_409586 [Blastocladiella britannica]|nr:hypothetical protein BC828DRAFT_409586 [Blastocladiella britannica]